MKPKVILLFFMFFVPSHPFKIIPTKCTTQTTKSKGFCRKENECEGAKEPLLPPAAADKCPANYVCCPKRNVSKNKCVQYSKSVFKTVTLSKVDGGYESHNIDDCGVKAEALIVGGEKAESKEFPHMAVLGTKAEDSSVQPICGGALISEVFILTAAHCIKHPHNLKVYVLKLGTLNINSKGGPVQERAVQEAIIHPRYTEQVKPQNDLALLRMNEAVKFTKYVRPICLDYKGEFAEKKVWAIGHGYTTPNSLKPMPSEDLLKVKMDVIDKKKCEKNFKVHNPNGFQDDSFLCTGYLAGGRDTCQGDSGGPIQVPLEDPYCMYKLLAVTSSGSAACGSVGSVARNIRVFSFLPWIENIVWPGES